MAIHTVSQIKIPIVGAVECCSNIDNFVWSVIVFVIRVSWAESRYSSNNGFAPIATQKEAW